MGRTRALQCLVKLRCSVHHKVPLHNLCGPGQVPEVHLLLRFGEAVPACICGEVLLQNGKGFPLATGALCVRGCFVATLQYCPVRTAPWQGPDVVEETAGTAESARPTPLLGTGATGGHWPRKPPPSLLPETSFRHRCSTTPPTQAGTNTLRSPHLRTCNLPFPAHTRTGGLEVWRMRIAAAGRPGRVVACRITSGAAV